MTSRWSEPISVPALLEAVLQDYNRNVPNARDAEVLKVMSAIITKLSVRWTPHRSKYSVHILFCLASMDFSSLFDRILTDPVHRLSWRIKYPPLWKMCLSAL